MSRLWKLCLALAMVAAAGFAQAQSEAQQQQQRRLDQPGNNAPVWREVRKEGSQENYTSIKGRETNVLVQSAGNTWRQIRNGPITFYGGWLVVLVALALAAFYFTKGPLKLHDKPTGRMVERFSLAERWAHWVTGDQLLRAGRDGPHHAVRQARAAAGDRLHAVRVALGAGEEPAQLRRPAVHREPARVHRHVREGQLYQKGDIGWLIKAWRMFVKGKHIPSWRFNVGEKVYFWIGVVALCLTLSVTGLILLFPNFDQVRSTMQHASMVHAVAAMVMIVFALGHIYVGTIGVEGAYRNMADGVTDEAWAKEHHELWYNEVKHGAKPAPRGAVPAGAPHMKEKP